jgi:FkbM family methyltransferase
MRRAVTRLLVPDRMVVVPLLGARLAINRRTEIGYWRAARAQRSNIVFADEVPSLLRIAALMRPGLTFVDCGANVGLFSAVIAPLARVHRGLAVHAFEPHPETFARLSRTLAGTGAVLENIALSNCDGTLTFAAAATSGAFGVPHSEFQIKSETTVVPCRRLDGCTLAGDSLFLKIDVEGHELEVLEGARGLFDAGRVVAVFVDGAFKEREVVSLLEGHRFRVLNAHSLAPYAMGDHKILAVRPS